MEQEKVNSTSQFDIQIILKLTEQEARALLSIVRYGSNAFLEVFYKSLGKSELESHEKGIHSLFETILKELPKHLQKADDVRSLWRGEKIAVTKEMAALIK